MAKQLDPSKLREIIQFLPHKMQKAVLTCKKRYITICWGRRSGKTFLAAYIALKYLLTVKYKRGPDGKRLKDKNGKPITEEHKVWIVAPTYDVARRSWEYLLKWVPLVNRAVGKVITINKSHFTMKHKAGSILSLKSADQPVSLLGEGVDLLIVDESARIPEEVWQVYLRPTLTDRQGRAIFISTPFGKNWFYNMMLKGISTDPNDDDYAYFHMRTRDNTTLPNIEAEVESAKRDLPLNDFMQEYEAEFIDGAGSVFRNVRDIIVPAPNFTNFPYIHEPYDPNHYYQGGLDLARMTDFTVETIVKRTNKFQVVAIDRFNELDYKVQKPRINLLSEKYQNPPINAEKNNIGDAIIDDLSPNFTPFNTTNQSKKDLINNLAILIEQKMIEIPNIPQLVNELEAFTYKITANGNITYQAPSGYHDDMVMSLALAVKDLKPLPQNTPQETYIPASNFEHDEY